MSEAVLAADLDLPRVRKGKVRECYALDDDLLIVATDRISAYDWVLPNGIPGKGRLLTEISVFWFRTFGGDFPHHFLTDDLAAMGLADSAKAASLRGRCMRVRKVEILPVECIVRGALAGSGWAAYEKTGGIQGIPLPAGLDRGAMLPEPIFTPTTKAETGHDEPLTWEETVDTVGRETAEALKAKSLDLFDKARAYARERGILLADTKFEWGRDADGNLILADEVLTPDSSRFWPTEDYRPGKEQPSFDKQFVRDFLSSTDWDRNSPPPPLPEEIVRKTAARYEEARDRLLAGTSAAGV